MSFWNDTFVERHPRRISLPLGLGLGVNVWGDMRFWLTLSSKPLNLTCQCGAKNQVGGRVYAKIPFSKRHKVEIYG